MKLEGLHILLTYQCNYECDHCFVWGGPRQTGTLTLLPREEVAKLPFYQRDLELAKRLLQEAGYPNGFEFTHITSAHSPDYMPGSQMLQSSLKEVGIKMNIQQVEWGIHLNRWQSGDFQMLQMWGLGY